jgi:hypothetical protein
MWSLISQNNTILSNVLQAHLIVLVDLVWGTVVVGILSIDEEKRIQYFFGY